MATTAPAPLQQFAETHQLERLTLPSLQAIMDQDPGYTIDKAKTFLAFQKRINEELLQHSIITTNAYTDWFKAGNQTEDQLRAFITQFSVFSNLFLIAQLYKMINADSVEGMHASKEILANEIGVIFNTTKQSKKTGPKTSQDSDPELVSTEGTVEGGTFRFGAGHFEWLLRIADKLDLGYNDVGKRRHGTTTTLFFCDELARLYGSENYMISQASSYAVENWAAAGFWDELINGFKKYIEHTNTTLPLAFFTWHSRIEAQHAAHTQEELEELYFSRPIDEDSFIRYGNEMLDGVAVFWNGLDDQRQHIVA